jgi:CheY-like chemotaxis protein
VAFKILLADDSMTAQNLAKKILTDVGYDVVAVSNGAAAIKKIGTERPDLLILDIYMPGYTGLEVCEKIKAAADTANTPVLLTVAPMEPYDPADGNRVRADGVILKPFEARDLVPAVEKLQEQVTSARKATERAAPERNLGWKSSIQQPEAEPGQPGEDKDREFEDNRPAPMPELPQEMAVTPAFLEQFGEEFDASPAQAVQSMAGLISPDSRSEEHAVSVAIDTIDAELASQSIQEFDLLSQGLPEETEEPAVPSSESEDSTASEYSQALSFSEMQAQLENDAANASLGELGFASGLSPQSESASSVDLDLTPQAPSGDTVATASDQGQDPELMVDRTEMIAFATRFASDTADETPLDLASTEYAEEEVVAHVDEGEATGDAMEDEAAPAIDLTVEEFSGHTLSQDNVQQDEPGEVEQDTIRHQFQEAEHQPDEMAGTVPMDMQTAEPERFEETENQSTLDQEVEETITQLPEFVSAGEEIEEEQAAPELISPDETEPQAVEWSAARHAAEDDRGSHDWQAADAAFGAIDASQFFQAETPAAEERTATAEETSAISAAFDEHALEEAIARVLDRLRPQIVSEVARELSRRN